MLTAYMNYPNLKMTVHADRACSQIGKRGKKGQRLIQIELDTLTSELLKFVREEHKFEANTTFNDMWLEVNLGDVVFEEAVLAYILHLVSNYRTPFGGVKIKHHQCSSG